MYNFSSEAVDHFLKVDGHSSSALKRERLLLIFIPGKNIHCESTQGPLSRETSDYISKRTSTQTNSKGDYTTTNGKYTWNDSE